MNNSQNITLVLIGFILGFLVYNRFFVPDIQTRVEYVEVVKSDTTYMDVQERVYWSNLMDSLNKELNKKPKVNQLVVRDTTFAQPYTPKIRAFTADFSVLYGNIRFSGEVLGELLKTGIETDFKIPTITNTITKEKTSTIVKQPSGLYVTSGVNNNFSVNAGAVYLKNNALIGYDYQFNDQIHSVKVGWKIF